VVVWYGNHTHFAIVVAKANIREHVIESLSWIRGADRKEIDAEIKSGGGDTAIDSKEGEAVCVLVEDALELGELVQASDLQPEQLTSVASLTGLFQRRIDSLAKEE